jgi:endonuclease/exonuclease/phosphatase family metal-dependent hydrolase
VSKTQQHDRHGGSPFETSPVFTTSVDDNECDSVGDMEVDFPLLATQFQLRVKTLNLNMQSPSPKFYDDLSTSDLMCVQEVTRDVLHEILAAKGARSFEVETAMRHGLASGGEGFDTAILYRTKTIRCLQAKIVPMPHPSVRRLLQVNLHMIANGALVVAGTTHLTASKEHAAVRAAELDMCLKSLEVEDADVWLLVGDLNMHDGEGIPSGSTKVWQDAFIKADAPDNLSNTWCPIGGALIAPRVGQWRFDRILYASKLVDSDTSEACVITDHACAKQVSGSFQLSYADFTDHKLLEVILVVEPNCINEHRSFQAKRLDLVRPGLGKEVAKRPARTESCAKETGSSGLCHCGKDYEKTRMVPGSGVILEDEIRKHLYRLYTRRNGHTMNSHDPLELTGLVANDDKQVVLTIQATSYLH